ncbi:rCG51706, isoform CRA_b [Rattus norvegicus]|uniref:RCG51706, isoform CRA_b n=1 Tax=Rattus norvegicus TaxID=10116 RepID=A6K2Y6_RAT|nr:rCG51706, isoform CRA_b [Rattus norvegicus]
MIFASLGWPFLPARESGLEQNSLGITTMKWAVWKARNCCAAVEPLNAEGGFSRGRLFLTLRIPSPGTGSF